MYFRQRGLSLIELMIAITLGLVLMAGVTQMFLSSQTVFHTQQAMSRIQENGRLGMEFITKDIRMAGYMGCLSDSTAISNDLKTANDFAYRMKIGIEGYTAPLGGTEAGMALSPPPIADTDILVVRRAGSIGAAVTRNNDGTDVFARNTGAVTGACPAGATSYSGICAGDILIVADCFKGRVFQATNITADSTELDIKHEEGSAPGNATTNWGGASPDTVFDPGADVLVVNHIVYFIANSPSSNEPSLYQNINGAATSFELLTGVENMHLTYSRRDTPEDYKTAAQLGSAAWNSQDNPVVSARVQLLVRSLEDNVLEESQTFVFPEDSTTVQTPTDRRMRQVFTSTVAIRNRIHLP